MTIPLTFAAQSHVKHSRSRRQIAPVADKSVDQVQGKSTSDSMNKLADKDATDKFGDRFVGNLVDGLCHLAPQGLDKTSAGHTVRLRSLAILRPHVLPPSWCCQKLLAQTPRALFARLLSAGRRCRHELHPAGMQDPTGSAHQPDQGSDHD